MGDVPGVNLMAYGVVLILMVTFLPQGIIGLFRRKVRNDTRDESPGNKKGGSGA